MSKNILKALFFLSIVSMVFVGGDVLAATCGSAIEQGWPTAPATNLCSDGTLSGSVYLDQQQGNWSWACSGGADPAFVFCSAPLVSDNGWMLKASWAYPRTTSTVASTGSKIYAVGGYRYPLESPYNSIEEYNPWTNNWTAKDDTYSYKSGMAAYVSGYVYFIGGQSSVLTGSNKRYSPSSDSWTDRAAMPTPRRSAAAAVANGKIYIFGGYVSAGAGWTNINEEYNPGTNNWTTKAPMPSSRMAMGAATVNNKIYVIGGILSTTGSATNRNEEYDPATNTWTTKAPMPTARYHTYPVVYDNKIYVIGGYGSSWLTVNEVYDPATNTWATANSMPQAVSDAVVAMANNKIYVMGGYDGRITLEYDPAFANGSCGTADGHGYYSTSEIDTVSERCATGTFTSFTDNGSYWSWTCSGSGGGSDASCSADKVAAGTDNEKTLKDQPSTNLCAYGTATTPTLSNDII
ncbi:MAG: kelch repeat-containing protein, partial [Candidatus Paceibacterota bacterium]